MHLPAHAVRTIPLTLLALVAFSANSLLCRLALGGDGAVIDAASFTTLRLASGALVLWLLARTRLRAAQPVRRRDRLLPPAMLFLYAIAFSYAYTGIGAANGALILFGAVQATMLLSALVSGERPSPMQWTGLSLALAGLVWLLLPGLDPPPVASALAMLVAGAAWGVYSLLGRAAPDAVASTAANFLRATPLALAVSLAMLPHAHIDARGAGLAIVSGALASGLGYVVWYAALRGLTATAASVAQLAVPVLTAFAAVLWLDEAVTTRLLVASAVVLGGVALATASGPSRRRA